MKKITFKENTVAIGLYWAKLSGEKLRAEIAALATEIDKPFGFTRKVQTEEGETSYQAALTGDKSLKGVISGAAALADKYQDLLFIDNIGNDSLWICAISNHEVLAGGDKVVSLDEAVDVFNDILSSFGEESDELVIVKGENVPDDIESDKVSSFDELIKEAEVNKFSKEFSSYKIDSVKSESSTILLAIVAVMSLGAIGYHFIGPGFGPKKGPEIVFPENNFPIDQLTVTEKIKQVPMKDLLENGRKEEINWLRNDLNTSSPSKTIMRYLAFDSLSPRHVAGWTATQIIFERKRSSSFRVLWKRSNLGTPLSFRANLKDASLIKIALTGNTAASIHDVVDLYDNGYGEDFDILGFIKNNPYKYENMMHDLISMGYLWNMVEYDPGDREIAITGIKNAQQSMIRQLENKAKLVDVGGTSRDDLTAFINILDNAPTFKINHISVNLETGFEWNVNGVLYEK
jgi:hypothetical protein